MVKSLAVRFREQKVTAQGGMKLMKEMVDSIGIKEFMSKLNPPEKASNRGYESIQIIEYFRPSPGRITVLHKSSSENKIILLVIRILFLKSPIFRRSLYSRWSWCKS